MKKLILTFVLFQATLFYSQSNNNWYLLAETGVSNSIHDSKKMTEFHLGTGIELSFHKNNSFTIRAKYLKTEIDDSYKKTTNCTGMGPCFSFSESYNIIYKAEIITIPLNYKLKIPLFLKKIDFFFSSGPSLNLTLNEEYIVSRNTTKQNTKTYVNFNFGLGFTYKTKKNIDIYLSGEAFAFGGAKTEGKGLFSIKLTPDVSLINIGLRYNLKK